MKQQFLSLLVLPFVAGCSLFGSLTSTTYITPKNTFVLGNNEHGSFKVQFQNASAFPVEVYQMPLTGGRHTGVTAAPNEKLTVHVAKNTALVIANSSSDTATVNLHVTGDTGLSMGYKK